MNQSKTTAKSSVLVIAGMHRSGSSLTTSLLQSAGLHIGRKLLGSDRGNEKGHFENVDFLKLHEAILRSQGVSHEGWTLQENISVEEQYVAQAKEIVAKNAVSSIWGWKEPRTTLFLDFWANLLPEANFLLIYRNPWDVVDSLYRRRDQTFEQEPELAVKFWLHYNQKIINFYNYFSRRCLLANIQGIIQEPGQYVDVINEKFETKLLKPSSNLYDATLFKTQDLQGNRPSLIEHYFPEAIEMYQELEARAWQPNESIDLSWRNQIKSSPYRVCAFLDWKNLKQAESKNQVVTEELKEVKLQLAQTQDELQKTRLELEQRYSQLHQVQEELEQFQLQFRQVQGEVEKARFQQTIAYKGDDQHELLVWSAWQAYRNKDKVGMAKYLQQSLKNKPFSPTETVLKWIESFTRFSAEQGEQLDTQTLVNSEEWQQLMRRSMVRNLAFSQNGK
ncbi:MAG: sulfotransferase [Limnoraphis robusta]